MTRSIAMALSLEAVVLASTDSPALALIHDDSQDNPAGNVQLSLSGVGFISPDETTSSGNYLPASCGTEAGGSFVAVYYGFYPLAVFPADDPEKISYWSDTYVVAILPASILAYSPLTMRVCTPSGHTLTTAIQKWEYEHQDVPLATGSPLAIATDAEGSVWINGEFHRDVFGLVNSDLSSPDWDVFTPPQYHDPDPMVPASAGIFAWEGFGPFKNAVLGEDVVVDSSGAVWFSESGGPTLYSGEFPNHSRLVMYDPSSPGQVRTFNVPGDNNQVIGIAWDGERGKIWFSQAIRNAGPLVMQNARLLSFYPECVGNLFCDPNNPNYNTPIWQGDFDFDGNAEDAWNCVGETSPPTTIGECQNSFGLTGRSCLTSNDCILTNWICPEGLGPNDPDYWCIREYDLGSDLVLPSHVLAHSDGTIWYSSYNFPPSHIGRIDPESDPFTIDKYPVPAYQGCPTCGDFPPYCVRSCFGGASPWSLIEEASGDVAISYQHYPGVGRFSYAMSGNPVCNSLDMQGSNPCITNYPLPAIDLTKQFTHSAVPDAAGNVWLSAPNWLESKFDCGTLASVAFLQAGTNRMLLFSPLSYYETVAPCIAASPKGLAPDPAEDGIWFTDYYRRRIGRLRPL